MNIKICVQYYYTDYKSIWLIMITILFVVYVSTFYDMNELKQIVLSCCKNYFVLHVLSVNYKCLEIKGKGSVCLF